jgi:hypothetical protein
MGFPNAMWGSEGDQYEHTSDKKHPFGTVMKFIDGREFVYAQAGGTALNVGRLQQQAVKVSGHEVDMVTGAASVGATAITVTPITNNVTANQYQEGFLIVNDEAGEGYHYKIKSHPAITASSSGVITLEEGSAIRVALTSSSQTGLRKHICDEVVVAPTTETGVLVGVAVREVTENYYCWLQVKGTCAVLTNSTVVVGEPVTRGQTAAGSVDAYNEDGSTNLMPIGEVETVGGDGEFSLINLHIR